MKAGKERYVLLPCSGRKSLGVVRGHLYNVKERSADELGWTTVENAQKLFGKDNVFVSQSDTLCPFCFASIEGNIEIKLLEIAK